MADKIQLRRDTAANWTSANPTLAQGEIGYETDTDKVKIGDGSTAWTSLGYVINTGDYLLSSDIGSTVQAYSTVLQNTTASFTTADETKLDGIEAGADVTNAASVTAAGALMDSELTDIASVKALNQGVATTDSPSFAGFTSSGNASFSATRQLTFEGRSDGSGSIDQLLKLSAGDIYGRPSVSYHDASGRHRASAAFHERDGTSGAPGSYHDAYEIKTSADPAGASPSVMFTRFSVGTDADLADVTVNAADNFYVRDGSSTTFAVNTGAGNVTIGDGTNEEVKIDIAGSRSAIGYDLAGGNLVLQSGSSKGISFCTDSATFASGEVWSITSAGVLTAADAVTGNVAYLGIDNVAREFGISGDRAKFGYSGAETYMAGGSSKGVGLRVDGSSTSTLSISSSGVTTISGDLALGAAINETVYALSGTTPALDPSNGTVQTWTLTGSSAPSESISAGEAITLMIEDGSGFTIDWATSMSVTWVNNGGAAPTLATTGYTVIALWKVSTTLYGALVGDGT